MTTIKSYVAALLGALASAGAISGTFNAPAAGAVGMPISHAGGTGKDVALTVNPSLTVTKAGSGSGTVTSDVGAINCGIITCSDTYATGTPITLTATPAGGNQFTGWLGPCTGTGACRFTINGATTVSATFASTAIGSPTLDIDGTTSCDALTDGLLVIRYLFGLSGASLINGAVGPDAARITATQIGDYLSDIRPVLDIDGNGQVDALTDGLLTVRYLFGLRGASLIAGAVGSGAIRTTAADIETQMRGGKYRTGVPFRGINRAGMEYGDDWDGWNGQTYFEIPSVTQTANELAYYKSKGLNIIRLPISWERIQHALNGPLTSSYVAGMLAYINSATAAGFHIVLNLHNYNRYAENTFDSSGAQVSGYSQRTMGDGVLQISHLADVWVKLTNLLLTNPKVILNLMNEPHDFPMTSTVWFAGVQTVINAIRATGSTHLILVPNSRGSDVDHWSVYAPNGGPLDSVAALAITDSANNYAFDMHAYQDNPTSGTSYSNLVSAVTGWAKTNGKKLFLSEMGSTNTATNGQTGIGSLLTYLNNNNDVWLGWTPWNLPPYLITNGSYTADGTAMAWYLPFLMANFLGGC